MTSHVHMIIGTDQDKMENILRDLKRHTSEKLRSAITNNFTESRREWMLAMMTKAGTANSNNINFQFWIQNNHPVELRTIEMAHQKLDYIHYNLSLIHISEPTRLGMTSYAVFCLQKKKNNSQQSI